MKKLLLLLICTITFSTTLKSQSWCYPGAQWYYTSNYSFSSMGYIKHTFTNTVTINSLTCQKIAFLAQHFSYYTNSVSTFSSDYYTYFNNNVVYLYDATSTNFDTLFNYNAVIGSKWSLPNKSTANCSNSRVTVTDTGHHVIQGVNLKWFKVSISAYQYTFTSPLISTDTIYERLGCVMKYFFNPGEMCPTYTDGEIGGPLRCYSDNQISNYNRTAGPCNYYYIPTGLKENGFLENLKAYPNPAHDLLSIDVSDSQRQSISMQMTTPLGQKVLEARLEKTIDIGKLENGIYFLQFFKEGKLIFTQKIIKD